MMPGHMNLKLVVSSKLSLHLWDAYLVCGWTSANLLINPTITPWNLLFFPQTFWNKTLFFHFSSFWIGLRRKLHTKSSGTTAEKNKSYFCYSLANCWKQNSGKHVKVMAIKYFTRSVKLLLRHPLYKCSTSTLCVRILVAHLGGEGCEIWKKITVV
jgi:hypothetical protein